VNRPPRLASRRWRALVAVAALLSTLACSHTAHGPHKPASAELRSVAERVAAEGVVELPLLVHQGYPFVAGEVNGRRGHFMVDNGTPFRFFFNANFAPVTMGRELGRGQAGSGQPIVVHEARGVQTLRLGPDAARELEPAQAATGEGLRAADFSFIETGVQPDFLGFVGAPWLSPFAFLLRYAPARWLLSDAGAGAQRLLEGSERVALIRFEGRDGSLPYATLQVDGVNLRARFDTGTPGVLQLTAQFRARLERAGVLRCTESNEPARSTRCELEGLRYGATALELAPLLTNTGSDNRITLGAALLSRYVTVWNLSQATIDLRRDTSRCLISEKPQPAHSASQ